MNLEKTANRLWKRLTRDERLAAATAFFKEPPQEVYGTALAVIVKARHFRPQVVRSMPPEEVAKLLASVLDPGELVASSLLVALHLSGRRPMLGAFLDALGLAHEDGILKEEGPEEAIPAEKLRTAQAALSSYPSNEVETYLNTLWLQDPDRWAAVEAL